MFMTSNEHETGVWIKKITQILEHNQQKGEKTLIDELGAYEQLLMLGFHEQNALEVSIICKGDLDECLHYLLSEECEPSPAASYGKPSAFSMTFQDLGLFTGGRSEE
eukprot:341571_1